MKLKVVAFFFCSVIFTVAFADSAKIDFWSDIPPEPLSKKLVESMDDEELLAQILMFGWAGAEPSDLLNSWVIQRGLGSVKVFGWNTDNIQKVAKSVRILQQESASRSLKIPLFVVRSLYPESSRISCWRSDKEGISGSMEFVSILL